MKFLADMHTHTIASGHAYSSFKENIEEASKKGLDLIAMTDHTIGMPHGAHEYYFMNLRVLPKSLYNVQMITGAEVNIIGYEGELDVNQTLLEEVDYVIASLHPPCIPFADKTTITHCVDKVMENPFVSTIGHPGDDRYPLDFEYIAKKAKETGTLLEINDASLQEGTFRIGVRENLKVLLNYCKKYETPVVAGTDAHVFLQIGDFERTYKLLEEIDFPSELVLNTDINKLLSYIRQKRLK